MIPLEAARAAIASVRSALDRKKEGPAAHYLIRGGRIMAQSGGLTASAPFPWDGEAFVSGAEFEAIIERCPGEFSIMSQNDGCSVVLRHGRFNGKIKTLPVAGAWSVIESENEGTFIDDVFMAKLRAMEPFVTDDETSPWNALIVKECRAYAVGSSGGVAAGIFATAEIPDFGASALIPKRALSIIIKGAPPSMLAIDETTATFRWPDGSWLRTQLVASEIPKAVDKLAEAARAGAQSPEITPEWREAFNRVAGFAEGRIRIYADRIMAAKGVGEIDDAATSVVPEGKDYSEWARDGAVLVANVADRWDLSQPQSAAFAGPLLCGLISGFRV